jgi:type II secretory pathway predicted ATPase ExeA
MALLTGDIGCGERLPNRPLIGQPELLHPVAGIPQLNQQIAARAHLGPCTAEETASYITVRTGAAAHRTAVCTKEAVGVIYEQRRGIGRLIEAHCDESLFAGAIEHVLQIGDRLVQRVGQVI